MNREDSLWVPTFWKSFQYSILSSLTALMGRSQTCTHRHKQPGLVSHFQKKQSHFAAYIVMKCVDLCCLSMPFISPLRSHLHTFNNQVGVVGNSGSAIRSDDAAVAAGATLRRVTDAHRRREAAVVDHPGHHQRRVFTVPLLEDGKSYLLLWVFHLFSMLMY